MQNCTSKNEPNCGKPTDAPIEQINSEVVLAKKSMPVNVEAFQIHICRNLDVHPECSAERFK